MIQVRKNRGELVTIVVACITLIGIGITAGVTYYTHRQKMALEYEKLNDQEQIIQAEFNGTLDNGEHYGFFALVGDIKATPENILSNNTSIHVPISKIKHFLTKLNQEKISAIFTRYYLDENNQNKKETLKCPSWPFKENIKFTAQKIGNRLICNITA
ncbi:MAG: hypothetical protein HRT87_07930 [Legionellales bacterium]|nr:hypothetical protein [Legionellales bacterium]